MRRTKKQLKAQRPVAKPSKLWPMLLGIAIVAVGFTTLMIRLEVTQEGYRLSALDTERRDLQEHNRRLRLEVAQLSSRERLRAVALKDGYGPPAPGHVVTLP